MAQHAWSGPRATRSGASLTRAMRVMLEALANAPLDQPGHPLLHEAQAVYAILEHEAMHQETMLYMWHQLAYEQKRAAEESLI